MNEISTITELVNLWPRRADMAEDLNGLCSALEVSTGQVHGWAKYSSIPSRYHHHVLVAARQRGFDIDANLLIMLHAPRESAA